MYFGAHRTNLVSIGLRRPLLATETALGEPNKYADMTMTERFTPPALYLRLSL